MMYLEASHPHLNDAADARRLVTTWKKPTTKDYWLPLKWVWKQTVPSRHKSFLWLAFHGRLNKKDDMTRKKWCKEA
jgi:hypothetical protein